MMKQRNKITRLHDLVTYLDERHLMMTYIKDDHITEFIYHKEDEVLSVRELIDGELQEVQVTMNELVNVFNQLLHDPIH